MQLHRKIACVQLVNILHASLKLVWVGHKWVGTETELGFRVIGGGGGEGEIHANPNA